MMRANARVRACDSCVAGTDTVAPSVDIFTPPEMLPPARDAGFEKSSTCRQSLLIQRYFAGRADCLRPGSSEALLVATT